MKRKLSFLFLVAMFTLLFATAVSAATPSKVTGLKQTDAGSSSFKVEWQTVLGQSVYYEVSMSTDGINYIVVEDRQSWNYYNEYYLASGSTYYIKVRAFEGSTYGDYSDVLKVVTAPEKVENVVQTGATTSSFTISWDKTAGATSYVVYKKQDNQEYTLGTTTGTSFTVKGLNNKMEVPFNIYVYPVNSSGTYDAIPSYSTGIYSYNLELVPTKVQNVDIQYYWESLNEVKVVFNKTVHSDGYQYQTYNHKGKKLTTGTTTSDYMYLKNIKSNRFYKVRVRSYVVVNNKTIYGAWSDYKVFGFQPKPSVKNLKKGVKISWKKVQGAKNYTVYMSTKEQSGYKKIKTLKKTSLTVTKFKKKSIKKNKTYYYYVVANTKQGKKTVKTKAVNWYSFRKY